MPFLITGPIFITSFHVVSAIPHLPKTFLKIRPLFISNYEYEIPLMNGMAHCRQKTIGPFLIILFFNWSRYYDLWVSFGVDPEILFARVVVFVENNLRID